jgi:hypothetical protein
VRRVAVEVVWAVVSKALQCPGQCRHPDRVALRLRSLRIVAKDLAARKTLNLVILRERRFIWNNTRGSGFEIFMDKDF